LGEDSTPVFRQRIIEGHPYRQILAPVPDLGLLRFSGFVSAGQVDISELQG
jgi:hypothetical protein